MKIKMDTLAQEGPIEEYPGAVTSGKRARGTRWWLRSLIVENR